MEYIHNNIMSNSYILTYDGSFKGFLSAISTALSKGLLVANIAPAGTGDAHSLFEGKIHLATDPARAQHLWEQLGASGAEAQRYIYYSFLSERIDLQYFIYSYIKLLFAQEGGDRPGLFELRERLSPWAQRVSREKAYLEANLRFGKTLDGLNFARIKPVFNVLPLLSKYCRNRFRDENWLVIDKNRSQLLYSENRSVVLQYFEKEIPGNGLPGKAGVFGEGLRVENPVLNDLARQTA